MELSERYYYDETSPTFLRYAIDVYAGKDGKILVAKIGDVAGGFDPKGYVQVGKGRLKGHRVIWEILKGEIPAGYEIDHIDGNKSNNSIENLRAVEPFVNSRNRFKSPLNTSGSTGIGFKIVGNNTYVRAFWHSGVGKQNSKTFSVNQLGLMPAYSQACKYREQMIEKLNAQGAQYSGRHGK